MSEQLFTLCKNIDFMESWEAYIRQFPTTNSWFVAMDTCWGNSTKPNDVIAFTICPKIDEWEELIARLKKDLPVDLKHTSHISSRTIDFLNNNTLFFSIAVMIRNIKQSIAFSEIEQMLVRIMSLYQKNTSHIVQEKLKKFNRLKERIKRKDCNQTLIKKLFIMSFLTAVVVEFLVSRNNARYLVWMPDREPEVKFNDYVIHELTNIMAADLIKTKTFKLSIGVEKETGEFVFDPLIRYADYISGTLASVNFKLGNTEKEKHFVLARDVIANHARILILDMNAGELHQRFHSLSFC